MENLNNIIKERDTNSEKVFFKKLVEIVGINYIEYIAIYCSKPHQKRKIPTTFLSDTCYRLYKKEKYPCQHFQTKVVQLKAHFTRWAYTLDDHEVRQTN